jgi:glycosyltransferase involved in cell wall biosynthesis
MGVNRLPESAGQSGPGFAGPTGPVDLTLFIACYNEEENIEVTLDSLLAALGEVCCSWEIIIIDDASTDRSVELIRAYQARNPHVPIHLKVNEHNRGLAHNYKAAAQLGSGTYYRLICADNCEPKETFVTIFSSIGAADIILPYHTDVPGKTLFRRSLSKTFTLLVNLISGRWLRYYNGLAVHRRDNIIRCTARMEGFGFQADIITRLLDEGASYVQVPVTAQERTKGRSKVLTAKNFLAVSRTLLELMGRRLTRLGRAAVARRTALPAPPDRLQDATR